VDFEQVLKEVVWRLVTEGRISYRRIKLSFPLDDDGLEELRRELIALKRLAADVDGELLVWAPDGRAARPEAIELPQPLPALRLAEMPTGLAAERDLPAAAAIAPAAAPEAERRQLTVMFCDLVGSTALSRAGLPQPGPGAPPPSSDARRRWGCYCGPGTAAATAAARSC
jgi:hypothetical protein